MKKSVILDIFMGNKGHIETMKIPNSENHFATIASDTFDQLQEKLSPELLKLVEQFANAIEDNLGEELDFFMVEAFKLGLKIGMECAEG